MTGADSIVKCLEAEGVNVVFGYPGVAICPFYNAILSSDIETVLIRTEQNAAHADITGYYADLEDIEYVFLDADGEVTENKDDAVALQFTKFTTMEYFLVGHVINKVFYNGASHLDVIVEGTWKPQVASMVTYLEIAEGAHVYGEITDLENGAFVIVPSEEELEPGVYGTKFVFVEDPNGSSGGESGGEEAEAAEDAESADSEGTDAEAAESAEGASKSGRTASSADREASAGSAAGAGSGPCRRRPLPSCRSPRPGGRSSPAGRS